MGDRSLDGTAALKKIYNYAKKRHDRHQSEIGLDHVIFIWKRPKCMLRCGH